MVAVTKDTENDQPVILTAEEAKLLTQILDDNGFEHEANDADDALFSKLESIASGE